MQGGVVAGFSSGGGVCGQSGRNGLKSRTVSIGPLPQHLAVDGSLAEAGSAFEGNFVLTAFSLVLCPSLLSEFDEEPEDQVAGPAGPTELLILARRTASRWEMYRALEKITAAPTKVQTSGCWKNRK